MIKKTKKSYFDDLSECWDRDSTRSRIALNVARTIHKYFESLKGAIMLDFGCGTGLLSFYFYPHLGRLDGIDTSPGMVAEFNRKAESEKLIHAKARVFDLDHENLPESEYDVVISSMVFHHLKNPAEALKKIYFSLKAGGKIGIADLDEEDGSFHPAGIEGVFHHGFSRELMKSWFRDAGYTNEETQTVMHLDKENKKYSVFLCHAEKH